MNSAAVPPGADPVTGPASALAHIGTVYGAFGFACVALVVCALVIRVLWNRLKEKEAQEAERIAATLKQLEAANEIQKTLAAGQIEALRSEAQALRAQLAAAQETRRTGT